MLRILIKLGREIPQFDKGHLQKLENLKLTSYSLEKECFSLRSKIKQQVAFTTFIKLCIVWRPNQNHEGRKRYES